MTPEEFREFGHRLVDWICDFQAGAETRPVMAKVAPGEIRAQLAKTPPTDPEPMERVFRDFERIVPPGLTDWQNPRFFGYFPSNALPAGMLGDLLATGLGVIGLTWQSCPALAEMEEVVTDWVRQMVGLSAAWSGVIQDTASTSTLVALICAREAVTDFGLARGGLQSEARPLAVYLSAHSHSSVEKAALLAGFGRDNLRYVPVVENFGMCAGSLQVMIENDRNNGILPCAVVATIGTTGVTAIDPLVSVAPIAREAKLWLHVDAAMGGGAMILPECRPLWEGIESADSLVINAHKWLGAPFDCSLYFVRDPAKLIGVMSTNPSYLHSPGSGEVRNFRDWGIPLGRKFRALKLWFLIREQGVAGLQARLRRDLANARRLAELVAAAPNWRVLAPVHFQTVCIRHEPGISGEALDRHTLAWVEKINRSGLAYLTPAVLDGRWMARVSIGALTTELGHVEAAWQAIRVAAQEETQGPG